jgi:transcription elongation factor SPT6
MQAIHRRIRRWDILWKVYDLAVQWRALARRQEARAAVIEEAKDRPGATDSDYEALSTLSEAVRTAQSPEVRLSARHLTIVAELLICQRSIRRSE